MIFGRYWRFNTCQVQTHVETTVYVKNHELGLELDILF